MNKKIESLIKLSKEVGREDRKLCILGEGNISVKLNNNEFAIKCSGCSLKDLNENKVVVCNSKKILSILSNKDLDLLQINNKRASIESIFHIWLLSLDENINYVAHCHPLETNKILCSVKAKEFADYRLFPDQIVYCGPQSCYVSYNSPGMKLANKIKNEVTKFIEKHNYLPKLIVLQNHGIISIGKTVDSVLNCILMTEKSASIFIGSSILGGPEFMNEKEIKDIFNREDEKYRCNINFT